MNPFSKIKERVTTFEVVLDALIGVLIHKKVLTRKDIQTQIMTNSAPDTEDQSKPNKRGK